MNSSFTLAIGPAGEIIREAGQQGIEAVPVIRERLRDRFSKHLDGEAVYMPSATWRASAKNPD